LPESYDPELWRWLTERLYYLSGDLQEPTTYEQLQHLLDEIGQKHHVQRNYFFYLATARSFLNPRATTQRGRLDAKTRGPVAAVIIENRSS